MVMLYQGNRVVVPRTADIEYPFFDARRDLIQKALDNIGSLKPGDTVAYTYETDEEDLPLPMRSVVRLADGAKRRWGIHAGHTASNPGLSPFIELNGNSDQLVAESFTVYVLFERGRAHLVRVFVGEDRPGLPWMNSVRHNSEDYRRSCEFWRNHAYVLHGSHAYVLHRNYATLEGRLTDRAPAWYVSSRRS